MFELVILLFIDFLEAELTRSAFLVRRVLLELVNFAPFSKLLFPLSFGSLRRLLRLAMRLIEATVEVVVIGRSYAHTVVFRGESALRVFFLLVLVRPTFCQFL